MIGYYGEKLGDAVGAASLVALALLAADALARVAPQLRESRARIALVGLAAVLASASVFQIAGYVGPGQQTLAKSGLPSAPGFQAHEHWDTFDKSSDSVADTFLDAVDSTGLTIKQTGELPEEWSYIDLEGLDARADWVDLWFAALVGGMDSSRVTRAYDMYPLSGVTDPTAAARIIATQLFPQGAPPGVRLVVPQSLVAPLAQASPTWVVGTNLFAR